MSIGDIIELTIIDDNHLGNGIAKQNNFTIFVPHTLKGDIVKAKITKITKKLIYTDLIDFIKKSKNHIKVECPYYNICGGCDLLHLSYDREKALKEKYIKKLFKKFNKKIITFNRYNYRNKVTLHVKHNQLGFYKEGTNTLTPIDNCLLLEPDINDLITRLKDIDLSNITSITIKSGEEGLLLSVEGTITKKDLNKIKEYQKIRSIYQNNKLIYGDKYIKIKLGNITYSNNNNSFFQVNTKCATALYDKTKDYVGKCNSLLDLYCGTGSIGIYLNKNINSITGIEINKDSVACAKQNFINNSIKNYTIINSDASFINNNYDVVIVDPPRSGLSKKVINILNKMNTKRLIYISCNPSTLKRDIDLLNNYQIEDINIFNMFPATKHIEAQVVLKRIK